MTDELIELYKVPKHTRIYSPDLKTELNFSHVDGMYSFNTNDAGQVVHLAAWAKVKIINKENPNGT